MLATNAAPANCLAMSCWSSCRQRQHLPWIAVWRLLAQARDDTCASDQVATSLEAGHLPLRMASLAMHHAGDRRMAVPRPYWRGLTKAAAWATVPRGSEQAAKASRPIATAALDGLGLILGPITGVLTRAQDGFNQVAAWFEGPSPLCRSRRACWTYPM